MAKSKKERRSGIRHMNAEGDVLAIFDALDRAEKETPSGSREEEADDGSDEDPGDDPDVS